MAWMDHIRKFRDRMFPECGLCTRRTLTIFNCRDELLANYKEHGADDLLFSDRRVACGGCRDRLLLTRCCKTGMVFLAKHDRSAEYRKSALCAALSPYHPSCRLMGPLCGEAITAISMEYEEVLERLAHWAGGQRGNYLRGWRIVGVIGPVCEDDRMSSPEAVEARLRTQTAQIGGNGYVGFHWDKHTESTAYTYIRGYGPKGNPWYGTRYNHTHYFTGYAVAVRAVPVPQDRIVYTCRAV